jgi:hypothetical protein
MRHKILFRISRLSLKKDSRNTYMYPWNFNTVMYIPVTILVYTLHLYSTICTVYCIYPGNSVYCKQHNFKYIYHKLCIEILNKYVNVYECSKIISWRASYGVCGFWRNKEMVFKFADIFWTHSTLVTKPRPTRHNNILTSYLSEIFFMLARPTCFFY